MTAAAGQVTERRVAAGGLARFELRDWRRRFGVVAGVTASRTVDFALDGDVPPQDRWPALTAALGPRHFPSIVVSRQVHGTVVARHRDVPPGCQVGSGADGHVTGEGGVLLGITVADCVPIYLLEPARGLMALLHAGWRGVAGGMLERGIEDIADLGGAVENIVMHCGVCICGRCYEVGPEVVATVSGRAATGPEMIDLRDELRRRGAAAGLREVTTSTWCTAHHGRHFWSHRGSGGRAGRMAAYLGRPMP